MEPGGRQCRENGVRAAGFTKETFIKDRASIGRVCVCLCVCVRAHAFESMLAPQHTLEILLHCVQDILYMYK